MKRVTGQHRKQPFPAARAQRGAAVQRERDITAQFGGHRTEFVPGQAQVPQLVQPDQRRGGIRAAARHAARHRNAFADGDFHQGRAAAEVREPDGRLPDQVRPVGRHLGRALAGDPDGERSRRRDLHIVAQGQRLEYRGQVVIAIGAQVADSEMEVHLRRRAHGDGTRHYGQHGAQA